MARISSVTNIDINSVGLASTLLIGDIVEITPRARDLAVQRQVAIFNGDEGDFGSYAMFSRPIPQPVIYEQVGMSVTNTNPYIKVRNVTVMSISAAAVMQVGSNCKVDSEARVINIRQLVRGQAPR